MKSGTDKRVCIIKVIHSKYQKNHREKSTKKKNAIVLPRLQKKKKPVDFDDELKTGGVRYDNLT